MKWIHNDKVSLGWAVLVEIAVHGLFAMQAFSLGGFLGEIALVSIVGPSGQAIGAWSLALFIFGAAFQAFVLGEYMQEHVRSFEWSAKGNGSYMKSWKEVRLLVAGIELSSLAFRCIIALQDGNRLQAVVVAIFGVIALRYAYAQAKVIHASVNRPVEYDIMQAQQEAGRSLADDAIKYTKDMTPEQKARFIAGDASTVGEVAQSKFFEEEQRRQAQDQKQQAKLTKQLNKQRDEENHRQRQEQARALGGSLLNPLNWNKKPYHHQPLPGYPKVDPSTDFPEALSNHQANHQSKYNGN